MLLSYWALLGFVAWTLLVIVAGIGWHRLSAIAKGEARPNDFVPGLVQGTPRYQRIMRAHMNCVENLALFASLVLLGGLLGQTGDGFQWTALAVLPARVLQTVSHVASSRNRYVLVRFGFYVVQLGCFTALIVMLARS